MLEPPFRGLVTGTAQRLAWFLQVRVIIAGVRSVAVRANERSVRRLAVRHLVAHFHVAGEAQDADVAAVQPDLPGYRFGMAFVAVAPAERPVLARIDELGGARGVRIVAARADRLPERLAAVRGGQFPGTRLMAAQAQCRLGVLQVPRLRRARRPVLNVTGETASRVHHRTLQPARGRRVATNTRHVRRRGVRRNRLRGSRNRQQDNRNPSARNVQQSLRGGRRERAVSVLSPERRR